MAQRDAVSQLPEELRAEIDRRLIKSGFSNYEGLVAWLAEQGCAISKSSLHRYGQKFEDRVQALSLATHQAKALVDANPDDEGAVGEALMKLVQEKLFNILLEFEVTDPSKLNLGSIAKAIAALGRTNIAQKKYATEVKQRAKDAAATVDKLIRTGGLTKEAGSDLRREILGIGR